MVPDHVASRMGWKRVAEACRVVSIMEEPKGEEQLHEKVGHRLANALISASKPPNVFVFRFQYPGQTVGLHLKIIMGLKVHPELRLNRSSAVSTVIARFP